MTFRISFSDYLNSVPLGWAFLHGLHKDKFEIVPAVPSRCADQLAAGKVDASLIPSMEYQRIPGLSVVPGIAVAADRAVRSVILVCRRARELRTVAVDISSRTSAALLKLVLWGKMGVSPEFIPHRPDLTAMLALCDAALLIGDAALKVTPGDYEIVDLAEAWIEWQGVPFVFAFWACRSDAKMPDDLVAAFHEAKNLGLRARPEIESVYSRRLDLPETFLHEYLSRNITYEMGSEHLEGLRRFYSLAHDAGLISNPEPIRFVPAGAEFNAVIT